MAKRLSENELILEVSNGVEKRFTRADWRRLGLLANIEHEIESHGRLLRSLDWGDSDYGSYVIDFVRTLIRGGKIAVFNKFPSLMDWLDENSPEAHERIAASESEEEEEEEEPADLAAATTPTAVVATTPAVSAPTQAVRTGSGSSPTAVLPVAAARPGSSPTAVAPPAAAASLPDPFAGVRPAPASKPGFPMVSAIAPTESAKLDFASGSDSQSGRPNLSSPFLCDIVAICALREPELKHLLAVDGHKWTPLPADRSDPSSYQSVEISTEKGNRLRIVAGAPTQPGMPASAVLATKMILRFRPKLVAMVGIAAGAKRANQGFGDIIAADVTFDHDSGKIATDKAGKPVFLPDPHPLHIVARLRERLQYWSANRAPLDLIYGSWRAKRPETVLRLHVGTLGSGMPVIDHPAPVQNILAHWRKLVGVEMEAYAVHLACRDAIQPSPHFLCLKSICDFATDKGDDWQEYAAFTAAELFVKFIKNEWEDLHL